MRGLRKGGLDGDRIEMFIERRENEDWNAIGLRCLRKEEERRTGRRLDCEV